MVWGQVRQYLLEYLRTHIVAYFFLVLLFIIGVIIGALAVKTLPDEQKMELATYLKIFFRGLSSGQTPGAEQGDLWRYIFLNSTKTIAAIWLLGFTIIGIPFVLFIIFTRGFVIGFTVGFLTNEYAMKGVLFALAAVLPHNLLMVPVLLVTGVSAVSFSLLLVRSHRARMRGHLVYHAVIYSLLCFFMYALMLAAGLVEVYISPVFMKYIAILFVKA